MPNQVFTTTIDPSTQQAAKSMATESRVAVVTGAGSGLGRAIAIRLATDGAAIAAVDIDAVAAEQTARHINEAGGRAIGLRADVSKSAEMDAAVTEAVAQLGALEIMVNNAGVL